MEKSSSDDERLLENREEQSNEESPADMEDFNSNPLWKLYETIRTYVNSDGVYLSKYFSKVPSEHDHTMEETEDYPSMLEIHKRLINGFYDYVSEIAEDFNTLWENIKKLNEPGSQLHKYAIELQEVMQSKVEELIGFQYKDLESENDSENEESFAEPLMTSDPLKERLHSLCKCLLEYTTEDGGQPILQFMEKPSKEMYPDYYERIREPIDMSMIEEHVNMDKYRSEAELLSDLKLMFCNYREYYGEESLLYKYTVTLQKVLVDCARALGVYTDEFSILPNAVKVEAPDTFIDISSDDDDDDDDDDDEELVDITMTNPLDSTIASVRTFSPAERKRKPSHRRKSKSINGYILYSSVSRKTVRANNPDKYLSFGDISRIVGSEWKKLPFQERYIWEKKAARVNLRNQSEENNPLPNTKLKVRTSRLYSYVARKTAVREVWECRWNNCDRAYKNKHDCLDHSISYSKGHVFSSFPNRADERYGEYQCQWNNCRRILRGSPPFPTLRRLVRHVKEVHILKGRYCDPLLDDDGLDYSSILDPLSSAEHSTITDPLTRRLYSWCKLLLDIRTKGGRQPMLSFVGKPYTKTKVPQEADKREPINLWAVYSNISANKYSSEVELLKDFTSMFHNYRERYAEDLSICKESTLLERILTDRARNLGLNIDEMPITPEPPRLREQDSNAQILRPSNNDLENLIRRGVDPLCTSSTGDDDRVDDKYYFMKVETPGVFEDRSTRLSDIGTSITWNDGMENMPMKVDPSCSSLISDTSRVDYKNIVKIEASNPIEDDVNTQSSDVRIPIESNNDIASTFIELTSDTDRGKNFVKIEKVDTFAEASDTRLSEVRIPIPLTDAAKPLKFAHKLSKPFNGYILFSRERRKDVLIDHPQKSFGDISRIIGAQWRELPAAEKRAWGDRAARITEETIEQRAAEKQRKEHEAISGQTYWECLWSNCANVFENQFDCLAHFTAEVPGHASSQFTVSDRRYENFQCKWNNCPRILRGAPPFPSLHRLIRHVKEVHIMKNPGRRLLSTDERSWESFPNIALSSAEAHSYSYDYPNQCLINDYPDQEKEEKLLPD